jgi:hypothetical protein
VRAVGLEHAHVAGPVLPDERAEAGHPAAVEGAVAEVWIYKKRKVFPTALQKLQKLDRSKGSNFFKDETT